MSTSPALWRWAVEDGEPGVGTEDELIRQLAAGRLPPYVLVWREGWGEWLPAMQVEDLAEAFPGLGAGSRSSGIGSGGIGSGGVAGSGIAGIAARVARPSMIPGIPPVPVSDYPRLRHLAKVAPLGWPDGFEGPEEEVITSEVPAVVLAEAARVMTQPTPPVDLGLQGAIERASRLPPERTHLLPPEPGSWLPPERSQPLPRLEERTPVSGPALPLATQLGLEALIAEAAPARSGSQWLRSHGLWIVLLLAAVGLGVTLGLRQFGVPRGWLISAREAPRRAVASIEAVTAALSPARTERSKPAPVLGCRYRQPPVELDDWASVDVRPVLHPLASGHEVAIGYAQSGRSATGGILDVGSLRLERQFWQQQERPVFSVTPLEVDGVLRYHVERQGMNAAFARAVAAESPVRIGMAEGGIVLGKLDQRPQKLWALQPGGAITVPEVAEHPLGFTLALRAGGNLGHVHVGLIDSAGGALAPLAELGSPEWDLGRPALASGPEQTVLAVSRRGGPPQPDELLLARARNGQLPTELRHFELPAPASAELGAPLVAALPDGSFALMWSQGASDKRQLRLQRLSPALQPLGPAFDVTPARPDAASAAPAALCWIGDRLLAMYFSRRDAGHSLWVGSISCGA